MLEIKMWKYYFLFLWSTVLVLYMATTKKSAETGCQASLATTFSPAYLDGIWSFGWKELWERLLASAWRFNVLSLRHPLKMKAAQHVETSVTTNSPSQDSFQPHDQIPSRYLNSSFQTFSKFQSIIQFLWNKHLFSYVLSLQNWELDKLKPAKLSSRIWQRLSYYLFVEDLLFSLLARECTTRDERVNRGWWAPIRVSVFPRWTGNRSTSNPKQLEQNSKLADFQKERARFLPFRLFVISVRSFVS